ncbi:MULTISPECIES: GNAT family N-acetyltransferase [Marinobacter]|uniref:GNAT family N-acetyltransferase n=1 Tax=Marinobacter TaxID=2742 RepID=UPI001244E07D|nr:MULTISPECIES: GNAT family N-acetyltransferase [Marinobacter]MBL3558144.1 GNAT family N-acetyltransferase [Marinobacter sp. JB05H06]
MVIRDVCFPSDSRELRRLIHEYADWLGIDLSYQDFEGEMANLEALFSLPSGQYTFAMVGSCVAGGVGFRRIDEHTAEVKRLYVRPDQQGKGIGRSLMENLFLKLKSLGYSRLVLDAVPPTRKAQALYERMGFTEIEPYFHNPVPETKFYAFDLRHQAVDQGA